MTTGRSRPLTDSFSAGCGAAGVSPSERASPRTLLRRLSYDLTGLPPSLEEIQAFSEGNSSVAYERAVDRLLRSPHFGERWARHWLDVARYAEAGYSNVRFAFAYTYRDWVIRALNEDMPYDLFVIRQLAADHLPDDEKRHLAALGFLTLGVNPFRRVNLPDKIDDRIDVVTPWPAGTERQLRALPRPQVRSDPDAGLLLVIRCVCQLRGAFRGHTDCGLRWLHRSRRFESVLRKAPPKVAGYSPELQTRADS